MQDLIRQEQFEIEILDKLNSRFSVDLDFWLLAGVDPSKLFNDLKTHLKQFYDLKDCACKHYTLLFELKAKNYPRSLKIEIREGLRDVKTEQAIAYSKYSNKQVLVKVIALQDMMRAKIDTFLERKEIRDVFDIEFLYKRGIEFNVEPEKLKMMLKIIDSFTKKDYSVKLGSLVEDKEREYYIQENFKILKLAIKGRI